MTQLVRIILILLLIIGISKVVLSLNNSNNPNEEFQNLDKKVTTKLDEYEKISELRNTNLESKIEDSNKLLEIEQKNMETSLSNIQIILTVFAIFFSIIIGLLAFIGWNTLKKTISQEIKTNVSDEFIELKELIRITAEEPIKKLQKETKDVISILENPEAQKRYLEEFIEEKRSYESNDDSSGGDENAFD